MLESDKSQIRDSITYCFKGILFPFVNSVGFIFMKNTLVITVYVKRFPATEEFYEIDDMLNEVISQWWFKKFEYRLDFVLSDTPEVPIDEIIHRSD